LHQQAQLLINHQNQLLASHLEKEAEQKRQLQEKWAGAGIEAPYETPADIKKKIEELHEEYLKVVSEVATRREDLSLAEMQLSEKRQGIVDMIEAGREKEFAFGSE
jgi:hypothetical protein